MRAGTSLEIDSYEKWVHELWKRDEIVFFHGRADLDKAEVVAKGKKRIQMNSQKQYVRIEQDGITIDPETNIVTSCPKNRSLVGEKMRPVRDENLTEFQRYRVDSELRAAKADHLISRFPKVAAALLMTWRVSVDHLRKTYRDQHPADQKALVLLLEEHSIKTTEERRSIEESIRLTFPGLSLQR